MAFEFKLPDIGEGVMEGEIVQWLVKTGDVVEMDQPLVEVMTDKATVVIPSPKQGKVLETRGDEGDVVAVGSTIAVLEASSEKAPSPEPPVDLATSTERAKVLAAPATRRLARELGVDLGQVRGTGPAGRVLASDVRAALDALSRDSTPKLGPAPTPNPRPAPTPPRELAEPSRLATQASTEDTVIPIRGVRGKIWDSMTRSAFSAPHFTFVEACDVTELQKQRKRFNASLSDDEPALTFLPFIIKAVCFALSEMPQLNGHVDNEKRAFIQRGDRHIGVAVASQQGLTVPVVRNAERYSLVGLAAEVRRLSRSVRDGQVKSEDLGGSTFTVTSLGREGGLFATPILNHPEVAILGVHRLQQQFHPGPDGSPTLKSIMNLSLSCDHRLIDGHVAARFCYRVIDLLQYPERLYMMMA